MIRKDEKVCGHCNLVIMKYHKRCPHCRGKERKPKPVNIKPVEKGFRLPRRYYFSQGGIIQ